MTDTTDIKALRELLCHEDLESDYHVGVTVTTLRLLLSKADQLEAERQRADQSDARIVELEKGEKYWFEEFKQAEAELAALKGDQVPVAYTAARWLDTRCKLSVWTDRESAVMEIGDNSRLIELFTAPQKPVMCLKSGYLHKSEVIDAIEAAGCVVSFSDERLMQDMSGIVKDGE